MTKLATDPNIAPLLQTASQEAIGWVVLLKSGHATVKDKENFIKWKEINSIHADEIRHAARLWRLLGPALISMRNENEVHAPARSLVLSRRVMMGGALAASIAGLVYSPPLGLWPSLADFTADFRTAKGERSQVKLTEGVTAELSTSTALKLAGESSNSLALQLISGEALLDVKLDQQRLFVSAQEAKIFASESTFNLRFEDDEVVVTCLAGKLSLDTAKAAIEIVANQQISCVEAGLGPLKTVDAASVTSWRRGYIVFEEHPLKKVLSEINRFRSGRVILLRADLKDKPLSGVFYTDRPDQLLLQISAIFGLLARALPGGIVFLT